MQEGELFVITNTKKASLWNKLRDRKFRDAFVVSQFKRSIPFQITALRKKLGWSQEQLADAAKVTQGVISRAENPNYGNLTLNTVLRVANGLDVGVVIEFVPFSRLLQIFEDRSEDQAPTAFEVEDGALAMTATKEEKESESLAPAGLSRLIGQVSEADSAQPITVFKAKTIGQAIETDTARPILRTRDTRPNPFYNRSFGLENVTENQRENEPVNPLQAVSIGLAA
jgi:transcriptional regulator with XRE-family HTH domain